MSATRHTLDRRDSCAYTGVAPFIPFFAPFAAAQKLDLGGITCLLLLLLLLLYMRCMLRQWAQKVDLTVGYTSVFRPCVFVPIHRSGTFHTHVGGGAVAAERGVGTCCASLMQGERDAKV